jgi:lysozyme
MDLDTLVTTLKAAEGWRATLYTDTLGVATFGYGHNAAMPISLVAGDQILHDDIAIVLPGPLLVADPWIAGLTEARQQALGELAFNLGLPSLGTFVVFLALVKSGQYDAAATDLLATLWAHQVGLARATRIADMIRAG